jgi:DNA-binding NtrC family response regulator/class 3 adenylate cyclase
MPHSRTVVSMAPTDRLVGQSPAIQTLRTQICHLAAFDGIGKPDVPTVLLQGETGTGKGMVARVIHDSGPRARGPFIEVNCAAIPDALLEAELFGFEAGAFSDAKRPKPGLFEAASGGTLFLDEIEALPLALQGKLLMAVEGKRVRRLGAVTERSVDVKLIAATQVELSGQVTAGRFRADLYHRLAVVVLELPPLRARGKDILVLAQHFLRRYAAAHGVSPKRLSGAAEAWLQAYDWPGNVRELSHLVERVTLLSAEAIIDPDTLVRLSLPRVMAPPPRGGTAAPEAGVPLGDAAQIRQALQQTRGNVLQAARLLGLNRSTLRYRMIRHVLGSIRGGKAPTQRAARGDGAMSQRDGERGGDPVEAPELTASWEQKLVAVLAIDLSVPMATGPAVLPYDPWAVARRWEQAIAEKVLGFGGVLLQRATPPLIAAFGLLEALEQLPQRAVQATMAIRQLVAEAQSTDGREPVPEVRQAIHLCTVLVEQQGHELPAQSPVVRAMPSIAVRLLGHAGPGEVLVCSQLGQMVSGWCELQAREMPLEVGTPHRLRAFSVGGVVPRRSPLAGLGVRALSPFVGRERELATLRELLAQVGESRGQVVGILGEPGVGKSRLLHEFRQLLTGQRVTYLQGHCLSYGSTVPYLPVLDLLRDHCGITEADSPEAIVEKVRFGLQEVGMEPDEWAPCLLHLLRVATGTALLAELSLEMLQAWTFEALRQMSRLSSRQRPLILAVEDLQWIDQTSEDFLASLVERMGGARILLLATYRPEYRPPWLGKSYVAQLVLSPLAPQDSLHLVRAVLQTDQVPSHVVRAILAKAEGNPFFLEEIVQTLVEQGGTEIQLPPTLQVVLDARVDRLPAEAKALLQTLAVFGEECSFSLLTKVVDQPEGELQRVLTYLQAAEFIYEQPGVREPKYTFKHALMQDVAYASLPWERRRGLHERAAQAIEALFHDRLAEHYRELAHHYRRSGNTARAVGYLQQAGQQTV